MAPSVVHLPNGQTLTVSPSFGGLYFKSNELNTHHNVFPPGWTIILHSEDEPEDHEPLASAAAHSQLHPDQPEHPVPVLGASKEQHIHRFKRPTR
ncbi:MAG: hypothetical protein EOO38_25395 [Cytophagaceae bacterium]|nr:MAG: hypothetical protein EOO38_25395 [Cytophagaceae bacterium]